ncbi:MAG TPA: DUF3185 domain-containing protein [Verrucomicrobia bacterium]|nr:DUF3185 domain-containing protein [Verrucomicrobiota bacterium]
MFTQKVVAVVLIAVGVVVLAYSGIVFRTPGKPLDLGPVHIATTRRHFIPPVAGAVALVGGIVLLLLPGIGRRAS